MKTPLQTHMENKSADGGLTNINSAKEYTLKIKVDTTELDEAIINKMLLGGTFYEVYERTSQAKKQLEIALTELEELGMKVDVVYLSDKER